MLTIITGLASSLSYAVSDMLSQRVTRETRPLTQVLWVLVVGVVLILPVALAVDGLPGGDEWRGAGFAALAGVTYFGAFSCLLRALRVGDLGLVSALNSLMGAYAAVVFIVLGAPLSPALAVALALCVGGAVLTSLEEWGRSDRAGVRNRATKGAGWAFASGALFGCVMVLYGFAGDIGWLSQAAISRSVSLAIALPAAMLTGSVVVPAGRRVEAAAAGALELGGLMLLTLALSLGPKTVASVTTTQFGTFAVVLGFVLLRERPRRHQWVGLACTIVGVSLLAAI
jgi:drug/metabolite transporter (DMT)-like permease